MNNWARPSDQMDDLERLYYTFKFRENFFTHRGLAFQEWFARLVGFAFGSDFVPVRPYGKKGDRKCDGRRISTKTIFAVYAPYEMKDVETIKKIDEDFHGAKAHAREIRGCGLRTTVGFRRAQRATLQLPGLRSFPGLRGSLGVESRRSPPL
jgi:hypothetical protein